MRAIDLRPLVITGNESAAWSIGSNSIDLHLVREPSILRSRIPPRIHHSTRSTIGRIRIPSVTFPSVPSRFFASIAISSRGLDWNGGLDCRDDWIITESSKGDGEIIKRFSSPSPWRRTMVKHRAGGRWWLEIGGVLWRVGKGGSGCWLWLIRLVNLAGITGVWRWSPSS